MTLYAVPPPGRESDRIRSWWVHLLVASGVTIATATVLILDAAASDHTFVPRTIRNICIIATCGAWMAFYIKRAETRVLEDRRRDRIIRDTDIAALTDLVNKISEQQIALGDLVAGAHKADGFAEGWLARSATDEVEDEPRETTVRLWAVP